MNKSHEGAVFGWKELLPILRLYSSLTMDQRITVQEIMHGNSENRFGTAACLDFVMRLHDATENVADFTLNLDAHRALKKHAAKVKA